MTPHSCTSNGLWATGEAALDDITTGGALEVGGRGSGAGLQAIAVPKTRNDDDFRREALTARS